MRRVGEHHRLVVGQRPQQPLVGVNEGLLFGRVELARHRLGLAVFQSQTMQQRDQPGTALVDDLELVFPSVPMMMRHRPPRKFRLEGVGELSRGHAQ